MVTYGHLGNLLVWAGHCAAAVLCIVALSLSLSLNMFVDVVACCSGDGERSRSSVRPRCLQSRFYVLNIFLAVSRSILLVIELCLSYCIICFLMNVMHELQSWLLDALQQFLSKTGQVVNLKWNFEPRLLCNCIQPCIWASKTTRRPEWRKLASSHWTRNWI